MRRAVDRRVGRDEPLGMLIGYARVSTEDQKLDLQLDALEKANCAKVFTDKISGARSERPGLRKALDMVDEGDVLVVWKLDRLGRSLPHLVSTVNELQARGVGFRSLQEAIDTTTPGGKLIFHVFAALAEFEREVIRERTKAGMAAARVRGQHMGRRAKLDATQAKTIALMAQNQIPIEQICGSMGISRATYFRYLKAASSSLGAVAGTLVASAAVFG